MSTFIFLLCCLQEMLRFLACYLSVLYDAVIRLCVLPIKLGKIKDNDYSWFWYTHIGNLTSLGGKVSKNKGY